MPSIIGRMRTMRAKLFNVRCGPGAIILPPQVKGLVLNLDGTTQGLRHFWKKLLPRIKYHNEDLPIEVRQGGAFLMVQYGGKKPNHKIHARNVHESSTILKKLLEETKAKEIKMTPADKALERDASQVFKRIKGKIARGVQRRKARNVGYKRKYGMSIRNVGKRKAKIEAEAKKQKRL